MTRETGLSDRELEDRLVHAAMHKDAQWWKNVKDRFKDWWDAGPDDEYQEEFGEPFPVRDPGTDEMYDTTPDEVVDDPGAPLWTPEDEGYVSPFDMGPPTPEPPDIPETAVPGEVPSDYKPDMPEQAFGDTEAIPEMVPVDSSNLESVGFNKEDGLLYIIFKAKRNTPRTMYRYTDADEGDFNALTSPSVSAGQYFHQNIRDVNPYSGPLDPSSYGL